MKITIVGAGSLGGALGRRWARAGHEVAFAVRDPAEGGGAVKGGLPAGARLVAMGDAAAGADAVVLAVPSAAVEDALDALGGGRGALDGVVLADATNPVGPGFRLRAGPDGESQAETIQRRVPGARVVKAFNQTGFDNFDDPPNPSPVLFVAGDDEGARGVALTLSADLGFEAVDAGPLVRARELEHLAMLWIALSASPAVGLGREFAFSIVRRGVGDRERRADRRRLQGAAAGRRRIVTGRAYFRGIARPATGGADGQDRRGTDGGRDARGRRRPPARGGTDARGMAGVAGGEPRPLG